MSKLKASVLQEFDRLIGELETLLSTMPEQSFFHVSHGSAYEETSKEQRQTFYSIRSRYLTLLQSIPSHDEKLLAAIEYVRNAEPLEYNMQSILAGMLSLKSDYEAGLFDAAKSPGSSATVAENMLREARNEVEHFQPPYVKIEIDRLENVIKRAVRTAFGEDSEYYKSVHEIFHPSAGLRYALAPDAESKRHIEEWSQNRERLLNLLEIMPDELRLNERKRQEAEIAQQKRNATTGEYLKKRWLDEPRATLLASIIGAVALIVTTVIGVLIGQANSLATLTNNAIVLTHTSSPTFTATAEPTITPSVTSEATVEP